MKRTTTYTCNRIWNCNGFNRAIIKCPITNTCYFHTFDCIGNFNDSACTKVLQNLNRPILLDTIRKVSLDLCFPIILHHNGTFCSIRHRRELLRRYICACRHCGTHYPSRQNCQKFLHLLHSNRLPSQNCHCTKVQFSMIDCNSVYYNAKKKKKINNFFGIFCECDGFFETVTQKSPAPDVVSDAGG